MTIIDFLKLINNIQNNPSDRNNNLKKLFEIVFQYEQSEEIIHEDEEDNPEVYEVIYELAYDLDFYEPNPEWRREDPSYYGNDKLELLIKEALEKIDKIMKEKEKIKQH